MLRKGRVEKPRPLLWEWLLLSGKGPLRRYLDEAAARDGLGGQALSFLPSLSFERPRAHAGGSVERIALEPLSRLGAEGRPGLAAVTGRLVALASFLGLADLHWENLVLGVDARGCIVFAPLDVEMILADLSLPTETKLLPDADPEYAQVCRHACGVRRVLPYLGKPVPGPLLVVMASGYVRMLAFLERHAGGIAQVFASLRGLRDTPIRVCLRGTDAYVRAASEPPSPPLLDAEIEQLARGDIPYFFRLYGRPGIHYYGDRTLRRVKTLPLRGDVPRLDPLLSVEKGFRARSRKNLREDGLFTLLAAFDHGALAGRHAEGDLSVTFGARTLAVTLDDGSELRTRRNLGGVVSNVYLPCRCGEVRTPFVPSVTRCRAAL